MPNWCSNILHVTAGVDLVMALAEGAKNGQLFNTVMPMPLSLRNTVSGSLGDEKANELNQRKIQRNIEKYGVGTWYDFANHNWGTKWDIQPTDEFEIYDENGNVIELEKLAEERNKTLGTTQKRLTFHITFDTAWSPPTGVYDELSEMEDVQVEAYFYEPGMAFVGEYTSDGGELSYQIPDNADDAETEIPEHLDEMFAISENMAMWEEDEEFGPAP